MTLLSLVDLTVTDPGGGVLVDRLSLDLVRGRVTALVGEPGAGAVLTGLTLLDSATGTVPSGEVRIGDDELLVLAPAQRRRVRGARLGALFLDPREAYDPGLTLAENLLEVLVHGVGLGPDEAQRCLTEELAAAGVPQPSTTIFRRAGELSLGVLQRACVALAAASGAQIVVAEAPTAALGALDAADVRDLVRRLATEREVGVLFITEDVAEAAAIADDLVLMYAGEVHEQGPAQAVLSQARGPYTRALLSSMPRLDVPGRIHRATPGTQPAPGAVLPGCRFAPRCPFVEPLCRNQRPDLREVDGLRTRCHFADETSWTDRLDAYHRSLA